MLNRGYDYTSKVKITSNGQSLLSHLVEYFDHSSLEDWQQNLNRGEVTLDGDIANGSEALSVGQTLVWRRPPWMEPATPRHFQIVFEDEHLLAVNKPSGLPTIPGAGYMENTLLRLVQRQIPTANPVHRLGRATSGLVLFAKTSLAARNLFKMWNTTAVQKIYRAISQGVAERDEYEITTPIGLVPHPLLGSVWAASSAGKPSRSMATVISRGTGSSTFSVSLSSGRPHQIRIHLASIGHPLVGDPLYGFGGLPLEHLPGLPGDGGYFLHARYLRFVHPVTEAKVAVEAPLPAEWPV